MDKWHQIYLKFCIIIYYVYRVWVDLFLYMRFFCFSFFWLFFFGVSICFTWMCCFVLRMHLSHKTKCHVSIPRKLRTRARRRVCRGLLPFVLLDQFYWNFGDFRKDICCCFCSNWFIHYFFGSPSPQIPTAQLRRLLFKTTRDFPLPGRTPLFVHCSPPWYCSLVHIL